MFDTGDLLLLVASTFFWQYPKPSQLGLAITVANGRKFLNGRSAHTPPIKEEAC
jgi:hypothetical protein